MLSLMNRLSRQLAVGGWIAASAVMSLTGCAEGEPPQGAVAPSGAAQGSAEIRATSSVEGSAQADVSATGSASSAAEPQTASEYDAAADTDPSALTDFHDTLSPYGDWVEDPTYGVVWVPSSTVVSADFAPYVSDGHWALDAYSNWVWVSDYSWGWAPFHYGRWIWIAGRGWSWIPGRVYAPAWVVWRTGYYDDYYVGWAPMPPWWYWHSGVAVSLWYTPSAPFVFCSSRYVFAPSVRTYIAPASRVSVIAPRTRPYLAASAGVASGGYRSAALTRGPTVNEAHVPANAVPAQRINHDPRAISFARSTVLPASQAQAISRQQGIRSGFTPRPDVYTRPAPGAEPARPSASFQRPTPPVTRPGAPASPGERPAPSTGPTEVPRPTPQPMPQASPRPALPPPGPNNAPSVGPSGIPRPSSPSPAPPSAAPGPRPSAPSFTPRAPSPPARSTAPRPSGRGFSPRR